MAYTFDGANKLVILSTGTVTLSLIDLWSRWKDWVLSDSAQYAQAFDYVGGESIDSSVGTKVPLYLFQKNGWKIRPQEASHTLSVTDGILLVEGGGDPFVSTIGAYNVRIRYQQPVQAIGYSSDGSVSAPTADENAAATVAAIRAADPPVPSNMVLHNSAEIVGDGTVGNPWRGVGVQP